MYLDSGTGLVQVIEPLVRYARRIATAGDLSPAAASALARLGRDGPQRLTDLARAEGVSQPGMTQLVTRMERDGLVRRGEHAEDRRAVLVTATADGLALADRRRAERATALGQLIDRLDPADQDAIAAALPALARLAETASTAWHTRTEQPKSVTGESK